MIATLPAMPERLIEIEQTSGPAEIQCRPADGSGCGLFLLLVGECVYVAETDLTRPIGATQRWECWTCWRAVLVRWQRPKEVPHDGGL